MSWISDLRHAARRALSAPLFLGAMLLCLAPSIGFGTTLVAALHSVLIRSIEPVGAPQLIRLSWLIDGQVFAGSRVPLPGVVVDRFLRTQMRSVVKWSGFRSDSLAVTLDQDTRLLNAERVHGDYFSDLRVQSASGRLLGVIDDDLSLPLTAVVSERVVRRWNTTVAEIVGRPIRVAGEFATIVGVVADEFQGLASPTLFATDIWIPSKDQMVSNLFGQLASGSSLSSASEEARLVLADLASRFPDNGVTISQGVDPGRPPAAYVVMAIGSLLALVVVAIAGGSLTNLLCARLFRRRAELALRLTLGATQADLVRLVALEVALVLSGGAVAGIAFARWGSSFVVEAITQRVSGSVSWSVDARPDWAVLLGTLAFLMVLASGITTVVARSISNVPALGACANSDSGAVTMRSAVERRGLIALQVGASTALLVVAALLARSVGASEIQTRSLAADVSVGRINLRAQGISESADALRTRLVDGLRRKPGVAHVAVASELPGNRHTRSELLSPDVADGPGRAALVREVTDDFLATLGISLRSGRFFRGDDGATRAAVMVVDEATAKSFWASTNPIGRRVWLGATGQQRQFTVVGVVANSIGPTQPREYVSRTVLIPFREVAGDRIAILVRAQPGFSAVRLLEEGVRDIDISLALIDPHSVDEDSLVDSAVVRESSLVIGGLGLLGAVVALSGLFGVVALLVEQRSREMAIRRAMGASAGQLYVLILQENSRHLVLGLLPGLCVGVAVAYLLRSQVFGLEPLDWVPLLVVPAGLWCAGIAAAVWPFRRVLRTPLSSLVRGG